jgi:uncharacterized membrane protein YedE/YeeE
VTVGAAAAGLATPAGRRLVEGAIHLALLGAALASGLVTVAITGTMETPVTIPAESALNVMTSMPSASRRTSGEKNVSAK